MKKYTNRIKLMPKFTKCMSLAIILTCGTNQLYRFHGEPDFEECD